MWTGLWVLALASVEDVQDPPAAGVLEFYAPWCSHCRRFAPEYSALADAADEAGINIAFSRINCDEVDCNRWGVLAYPTLVWLSTWTVYDGAYDRLSVAAWVDQQMGQGPALAFARMPAPTPRPTTGEPKWRGQATPQASDITQAMNTALAALVPLLAVEPLSIELSEALRITLDNVHEYGGMYRTLRLRLPAAGRITAREWQAAGWRQPDPVPPTAFCGSPGTSCHAWALMHTVVARSYDPVQALKAVAELVASTLKCTDCVDHYRTAMREGIPPMVPSIDAVVCRQSAVLWLWRVHNDVNSRLHYQPFPSETECPNCGSDDAVYAFLDTFYAVEPPLNPWEFLPAAALVGPLVTGGLIFARR